MLLSCPYCGDALRSKPERVRHLADPFGCPSRPAYPRTRARRGRRVVFAGCPGGPGHSSTPRRGSPSPSTPSPFPVGHRAAVAPLPAPAAALVRRVAEVVGIAAFAWAKRGSRRSVRQTLGATQAQVPEAVRALTGISGRGAPR